MKEQTLGQMIASLRKARGMTQLELAEKMGVTDKAVSKWERDLSCPDIGSLPRLAELFGVSVDELIRNVPGTAVPRGGTNLQALISLVLKGVAAAMGVAVVVSSLMKTLDAASGFTMLGLGLACAGLALLQSGARN